MGLNLLNLSLVILLLFNTTVLLRNSDVLVTEHKAQVISENMKLYSVYLCTIYSESVFMNML